MISFLEIGLNFFSLLKKDIPEWFAEFKVLINNKDSSQIFQFGLKSSIVAARVFVIISLCSKNAISGFKNLEDLSDARQKLIDKCLLIESLAKAILIGNDCYKEGVNIKKNQRLMFDSSRILVNLLKVAKFITLEHFQFLEANISFFDSLKSSFSLLKEPSQLYIIYDFALFEYDRLFPNSNIEATKNDYSDLRPVELGNLNYKTISSKNLRNHVFRNFKDYFSKKPIRYPVIVLDDNNLPISPVYLFERSTLMAYIVNYEPLYPGSQFEVKLKNVMEHFPVRNLIEREIRSLKLQKKQNMLKAKETDLEIEYRYRQITQFM